MVLVQSYFRNTWKPVAFTSRSMTEVERRYAQIEKEALATTWACEKFADYILGAKFTIETDHKPLVPLLSTTHLHRLPPRVLHFRLRLNCFDYNICHVPGRTCILPTLFLEHLQQNQVLTVLLSRISLKFYKHYYYITTCKHQTTARLL